MKYRFIESNKNIFAVGTMCRVLQVSVSGYYGWTQRHESTRSKQNRELMDVIKQIHDASHKIYGSPCIAACLQEKGYQCSRRRTARLMRVLGIQSRIARKYKVTTDSQHTYPIEPNLLDQKFSASLRNKVWTSDITYIQTGSGWLSLTVMLDLFNREIVGHSFSSRLTAETTVTPALEMAFLNRRPATGLIVHSDRGSQYASETFRKKLDNYRMIQSMSGKRNCYDNAVTETFFKTLKTEWVYGTRYRNHKEARHSLFEYIEVFYNRQRKHSTLGYKSPIEFLHIQQQIRGMAS